MTLSTKQRRELAVALASKADADEIADAIDAAGSIETSEIEDNAVTTAKINDNAVTSSKLDEKTIKYAEVSLTNAQVLALRATPITLVSAPGAGKVIEFVSATLLFDYTAAYTETDDNLAVKYENGAGVQASDDIETTGFLDATADTVTFARKKVDGIVAKSGCENKALVLHNIGGDEFGGGNASNALRVKVAYRVHTTGF